MQFSAIIFDRDGVLSDFNFELIQEHFSKLLPVSAFEIANDWMDWGTQIGFPTSVSEEVQFFAGFWEYIAQKYSLNDKTRTILKATDYSIYISAYPEVHNTVKQLSEAGFKIGCLSDFSLASLDKSLSSLGILQYIDATCSAATMQIPKPFPAAYLQICDKLGVKPEECLFFDDEWENVLGGRRVGMDAYLIDRSGRSRQDPSNSPAFFNLEEALNHIQSISTS